MKKEDVVIGATSLYEIDKLITDAQETPETKQLLEERLLTYLQAY